MTPRYQQILELLKVQPNESFLLFAKAQEERNANDLSTARASFEQLLDLDPDYVGLYFHLADVYDQLDQPDKVESCYRKGIEVALAQNEKHALSELKNAYVNWQLERPG